MRVSHTCAEDEPLPSEDGMQTLGICDAGSARQTIALSLAADYYRQRAEYGQPSADVLMNDSVSLLLTF